MPKHIYTYCYYLNWYYSLHILSRTRVGTIGLAYLGDPGTVLASFPGFPQLFVCSCACKIKAATKEQRAWIIFYGPSE